MIEKTSWPEAFENVGGFAVAVIGAICLLLLINSCDEKRNQRNHEIKMLELQKETK